MVGIIGRMFQQGWHHPINLEFFTVMPLNKFQKLNCIIERHKTGFMSSISDPRNIHKDNIMGLGSQALAEKLCRFCVHLPSCSLHKFCSHKQLTVMQTYISLMIKSGFLEGNKGREPRSRLAGRH